MALAQAKAKAGRRCGRKGSRNKTEDNVEDDVDDDVEDDVTCPMAAIAPMPVASLVSTLISWNSVASVQSPYGAIAQYGIGLVPA
jgi:hypothetical protein